MQPAFRGRLSRRGSELAICRGARRFFVWQRHIVFPFKGSCALKNSTRAESRHANRIPSALIRRESVSCQGRVSRVSSLERFRLVLRSQGVSNRGSEPRLSKPRRSIAVRLKRWEDCFFEPLFAVDEDAFVFAKMAQDVRLEFVLVLLVIRAAV